MGPTRKRDLTIVIVLVAVVAYLVSLAAYPQWFPPITLLTGISLLVVAAFEAAWGRFVRSKISDGEIGVGAGRLHPLAVARTVWIAKASAWAGALVLGWWLGLLTYLLPNRGWLRAAGEDTPGSVIAAVCALALIIAALWLQHCCEKPEEPPDSSNQPSSD
jgi:hypothetical protein